MGNDNSGRESGPTPRGSAALGNTTKFVFSPRKSIEKFYLLKLAKELLPDFRIKICMSHLQQGKTGLDVMLEPESRYIWFTNLQRCGSGWTCAFCANKKSEQNRAEISTAVIEALEHYIPFMVTFTLGHHRDDSLAELLKQLSNAYRYMQQQKAWKLTLEDILFVGSIRALEVTYSDVHGWHPHYHVIVLLSREILTYARNTYGEGETEESLIELIARDFRNQLSTHHWRPALVENGGYCSDERGVSVTAGYLEIIAYVAKHGYLPEDAGKNAWGVAEEIALSASKLPANDGKGAWDLLREYGDGIKRSGALFREYAIATKGLNQLRWSPGLRDRLSVLDIDEQTVLENEPDNGVSLLWLNLEQWRAVRRNNAQAKLIQVASEGTIRDMMVFVNSLSGLAENDKFFVPGS